MRLLQTLALIAILQFNSLALVSAKAKKHKGKRSQIIARLRPSTKQTLKLAGGRNLSAQCPDHVKGEVIVKFKSSIGSSNGRLFRTLANSEPSEAEIENYLKQRLPNIADLKAKKSFSNPINQTKSKKNKSRITENPQRVKKLALAARLRDEYGLNRVFVLATEENNCSEFQSLVQKLNEDPNVEYAELNGRVKVNSISSTDPYYLSHGEKWGLPYDELWGLKLIQADKAWDYSIGSGVVVAVIDTGVDYNHPDLWNNIWVNPELVSDLNHDNKINLDDADLNHNLHIEANEIIEGMFGYDFAYRDNDPNDKFGHGTHVAGTIAASANNIGIIGVAPNAQILSIRGLDDDGYGYYENLADAILYATNLLVNNPDIQTLITNNSWGGSGHSQLITDAFQYASDLGVINIAAAGNDNDDAEGYTPANLASVITVAASTTDKQKSGFSNYGNKIDIVAPGGGDSNDSYNANIVSTINLSSGLAALVPESIIEQDLFSGQGYMRLAGTSMAAPHITGVVALILAKHPEYNLDQIKSLLRYGASDIQSDSYIPSGLVNALEVTKLDRLPPAAELLVPDLSDNGNSLKLSGTVNAALLQSYTLEYSADRINWTEITHGYNPVTDNTLGLADYNVINEGDGFFRLTATDSSGLSSSDQIKLNFKLFEITSPRLDDIDVNRFFREGTLLPFTSSVYGPNSTVEIKVKNRQTLSLNYIKLFFAGQELKTPDLISTVNTELSQSAQEQTIASVNTARLTQSGVYEIEMSLSKDSTNTFIKRTKFVYDAHLIKNWPLRFNFPYNEGEFITTDINNDGINEVPSRISLAGDTTKSIKFFNANGLTLRSEDNSAAQGPLVTDLDGDGNSESITLSTNTGTITVFDNQGHIIRIYTTSDTGAYSVIDRITVSDINADGIDEILAVVNTLGDSYEVTKSQLYIYYINRTEIIDLDDTGAAYYRTYNLILRDLNNDGVKEIITQDQGNFINNEYLTVVYKLDGSLVPGWSKTGHYPRGIKPKLVISDLDRDANYELIVTDLSGITENEEALSINVYRYDGSQLEGWPKTIKNNKKDNILFDSGLIIGDMNNDRSPEIIFSTYSFSQIDYSLNDVAKLYVFSANGSLVNNQAIEESMHYSKLPNFSFATFSGMLIANIDADPEKEIITQSPFLKDQNRIISAYNYDGSRVQEFEFFGGYSRVTDSPLGGSSSLALGDYDGDKLLEIVTADGLGYFYMYDTSVPSNTAIDWGMAGHDAKGSYTFTTKPISKLADLSLFLKFSASELLSNANVTLTLTAVNNKNIKENTISHAYGVKTEFDIPAELTIISKPTECQFISPKLVCDFSTISSGQYKTKTLVLGVSAALKADKLVTLSNAKIKATSNIESLETRDPHPENNVKILAGLNLIKVIPVDLSISASLDQVEISSMDSFNLNLSVTNNRNENTGLINDVDVAQAKLKLPSGATFISATEASCKQVYETGSFFVLCNVSKINSASSKSLSIKLKPSLVSSPQSFSFNASVNSSAAKIIDLNTANNTSNSVALKVLPALDLRLDLTTSRSSYANNALVTVTMKVSNKRATGLFIHARSVEAYLTIPENMTYYDYDSSQCSKINTTQVKCSFSTIVSGSSRSHNIYFRVKKLAGTKANTTVRFEASANPTKSIVESYRTIEVTPVDNSSYASVLLQ